LAKKVYFVPKFSSNDTILYDFNLNIGDTIKTYVGSWGNPPTYVTSIDSILVGTHYNKRFNLQGVGANGDTSLIEGIGSTNGLLESLNEFEANATLLCFSRDAQTYFPSYSTGYCAPLSITENTTNNEITISPNPTTSQTIITFSSEQKNTKLKVLNVLGETIQQLTTNNQQLILDMSGFAKGIYFVRIEDEKKNVVNRKIVVQ
jgi:Secretion system C-terminal sorting domain